MSKPWKLIAVNLIAVFFIASLGKPMVLSSPGSPKVNITYCGMLNKDVYSIKSDQGDLYLPTSANGIPLGGLSIRVLKVTPFYMNIEVMEE